MKKTPLLSILTALALSACAKEPAAQPQPETDTMNNQPKALVAYFSATGTTKGVAERLAAAIGAGLYEIAPETPYGMADLDWRDKNSRSSVEMADRASRPVIAGPAPDLSGVEVVVPFATSGGSGMGDSSANLQALAPAAKVAEGRRFRGSASADELAAWAREFR